MQNIPLMDSPTQHQLWSIYSARNDLARAIAALETVCAGLAVLGPATEWAAGKAVRALHTRIDEMSAQVAGEIDCLWARDRELLRFL